MPCSHTMRVRSRGRAVTCGDCGKSLKKAPKPKTFALRGADCHKFLRAFDPTFPLHPDKEKAAG